MLKSSYTKINLRNGLLFALPWLIGLSLFYIYPIIASLYYSFSRFTTLMPSQWMGLENYKTLFLKDELFYVSTYNTFYYVSLYLPGSVIIGIGLAVLLNVRVKGMTVYRAICYLPVIVPLVVSAIVWMWFLNPQYGPVNALLEMVGISGLGWFSDPMWSKLSLVLVNWWMVGWVVLIYLAGLQDIPHQIYEAAEIDGASWWHKTIHITIPMLSPVILFNLIWGLIGAFQYFTEPYVITGGGPANSTLFYSIYLYRNAFTYFKMGYASAIAWLVFLIIFVLTILIFKSAAKWVYYGGKIR